MVNYNADYITLINNKKFHWKKATNKMLFL